MTKFKAMPSSHVRPLQFTPKPSPAHGHNAVSDTVLSADYAERQWDTARGEVVVAAAGDQQLHAWTPAVQLCCQPAAAGWWGSVNMHWLKDLCLKASVFLELTKSVLHAWLPESMSAPLFL